MVITAKQTTLVIFDDTKEGTAAPTTAPPESGGNTDGTNSYWQIPDSGTATDTDANTGNETTASDSGTTDNSYWQVPDTPPSTTTTPPAPPPSDTDNSYWQVPDSTPAPSTATASPTLPTPAPSANSYWELPPVVGGEQETTATDADQEQQQEEGLTQSEGEEPPPSSEGTTEDTTTSSTASGGAPSSSTSLNADEDTGILTTLRLYDQLRQDLPQDFVRAEDSNLDILTLPDNEQYAFCHLSAIIPFTHGDYVPWQIAHEDAAVIAMAVQDLNTGNGVLVPELQGLNERCKVRFTTEWADTEFQGGVALRHVVTQHARPPQSVERIPCAFVGAYRSAVSIPMSIVTGLFDYPQISAGSTSADLDDSSQYPLFGRTLPADDGNAIPIIIYLRHVLQIQHLAVINVNDAYGNAFVEGMRRAAEIHATDMVISQIPLDESDDGIPNAIHALKATTFRYIFMVVFTSDTHDAIMEEAYAQGVAGDGQHNWLFGDSFLGTLDGRTFPLHGPLHLSYRGCGLLEVTGGVPGMPKYDAFAQHMAQLHANPIDLTTIGEKFPPHNADGEHPEYNPQELFTDTNNPSHTFLNGLTSGFAAFMYEAVVGLGLAACQASNAALEESGQLAFSGSTHFDYFKNLTFEGIGGQVVFDPATGTRDPASALYKVTNYVEQIETDDTTGAQVVRFVPVNTDLFQGGEWNSVVDYVFNDGTTNLPPDLPPAENNNNNSTNVALIVVIPLAVIALLAGAVYFYLENKRKKNDSVWVVAREDIQFADPPEIIGRGTFGLVLLGEYRGTQVAVKRVIPPKSSSQGSSDNNNRGRMSIGLASQQFRGSASGMGVFTSGLNANSDHGTSASATTNATNKGTASTATGAADMLLGGGLAMASMMTGGMFSLAAGKTRKRESEAAVWKRMKKDFIEEMRYLSKLRHPCITTVMGAVTKGEPMLIMEYMDHGSLYDILHNETMAIEGELILPLLRDITQGVRFLHSADPQVIHGDLKAQNILVDNRFRAKVADFGLSQKENLGGTGTPYWMAPELLRKESFNTSATDVYSFGVILYEVFSRRDPYEGEDYDEVIRLVADKKVQKRPPAPRHMPDPIKALMQDCLEDEADRRPACDELDTRLKRIDAEAVNSSQNTGKSAQVSLFDIFPRHIAEALRDGRSVEAEHKESVTIFFSDIVGFTNISSELEPRKVADMLDRLYTKFDGLSSKHDIFKVETIGDAYMAVTNLVKDQSDDHAKRIAQFAIDAIAAANDTQIDVSDKSKGVVNIRVGFHSGPVVADVVGTRNPRYCLFGDTVNTASRMESNSEVNRIHCSRASVKLLQKQMPELPLKSRGKVKIKGKGSMHTYWVNEQGRRGTMERDLSRGSLDDSEMHHNSSQKEDPSLKTLLTNTKIETVEETPSDVFTSGDIEAQPEAARPPEEVPEPTPFGRDDANV